ncbi:hypothetical protein ACTQ5K_04310 [Niallia sp. Sow4_A1]|uniref:YqgU-like beta propeller domain-containing protein n=1 Tax=unclassified Niallia TaxID=2837522 RepID=UPI00203C9E64|nr:hypothetical protein [Niallia sp. MER TA 168]MCM3360899.1 hypothetical protein [Niallia sp. MER TA 168]
MFSLGKRNTLGIVLLFTFFTLILSSCAPRHDDSASENEAKDNDVDNNAMLPPISPIEGEFEQVYGWIKKDTICYSSIYEGVYEIYAYNIYTGKHIPLYKSEEELSNVLLNENQLLIYTALSEEEGEIHIIDYKGNEILSRKLQSYETDFSWNSHNENELLITTLTKEWESKVFTLDIQENVLSDFPVSTPFPQWLTKEKVMYLDWDQSNPSLYAPLKIFNLETEEENEIDLANIYFIDQKNEFLLTISSKGEEEEEAVYTFYDANIKKQGSISVPRLSKFANWLVPNYTIYKNSFLTFTPERNGNAETYQEGFELIEVDMETGLSKKLFADKDLEDQPIQISSDGKYCLYGYYFENMLNMETGDITPLFTSNIAQ